MPLPPQGPAEPPVPRSAIITANSFRAARARFGRAAVSDARLMAAQVLLHVLSTEQVGQRPQGECDIPFGPVAAALHAPLRPPQPLEKQP
ncbi:hypothetical protein HMPREF1550_01356 [Actinomyces sp. oral taxon 877 str. F0543]|nr:hypothetical protein HMPREF1550_01356 [Actinomyces sp. oral taxon 877 str. F0543]